MVAGNELRWAVSVAFLLSLCLTPLAGRFASWAGVVSNPNPDRWNGRPVPMMGGLAIYVALVLGVWVTSQHGKNVLGILFGGGFLLVLGACDDKYAFRPQTKLIGQILAACMLAAMGIKFKVQPAEVVSIGASVLWIVAIINAINLMDNMDGLAPGVSLIAALFLSILLSLGGRLPEAVLAASLAGALGGFLFFNFPPARIFMGDAGSMSVGIILAGLSLSSSLFAGQKLGAVSVLVGPALVLAVPLFDVFLVSITRILRGQPISQGGRDHSSHRLVLLGLSERKTLLILYVLATLSGLTGVRIGTGKSFSSTLVLVPILWLGLGLFFAYLAQIRVKTGSKPASGKIAIVVGWVFKRRMIEVLMDLGVAFVCFWLAYLLRFDFELLPKYRYQLLHFLPWVMGLTIGSLHFSGVYEGFWEHYGIRDIFRFGWATILSVMSCVLVAVLLYRFHEFPRSVFPLYGMLLFLTILFVRTSFHLFDILLAQTPRKRSGLLIVGTDTVAQSASLDIGARDKTFRVVAFLDGKGESRGMKISGIPIIRLEELEDLDRKTPFSCVIFTDAAPTPDLLEGLGAYVRVHPKQVKRYKISYEDFILPAGGPADV